MRGRPEIGKTCDNPWESGNGSSTLLAGQWFWILKAHSKRDSLYGRPIATEGRLRELEAPSVNLASILPITVFKAT